MGPKEIPIYATEHPILGRKGYALPNLWKLAWIKMTPANSQRGITFKTDVPEDSENWCAIPDGINFPHGLKVTLSPRSKRNILIIGENANLFGQFHLLNNDGLVIIGGNQVHVSKVDVTFHGNKNLFFWGAKGSSNGFHACLQGQNGSVIIGEGSMFATQIMIRDSDMHPIISMEDGSWLNKPQDVLIEPHVWVCQDALIMKGTKIGFGSIVAARALVSGPVPEFSLAAGMPAKAIKTGVSWDRHAIPRSDAHIEIGKLFADMERDDCKSVQSDIAPNFI